MSRPLVFAHRGGAALRPENTLAAFDHGLTIGADGVELDVRLSRDGAVVVHHDATVDRTTDGRGPVAGRTADELARLDAAFRFDGLRGQGIGVPALRDVLRRYRDTRFIVELKLDEPELARRTIDEVKAADAIDRVSLGSFGRRVLRAARAYEPRIATGAGRDETRLALYRSWCRWPVRRPSYRAFQVPEVSGTTRIVSPRFVRDAHRANVAVQVWTVDDEADMRRLIGWDVDALITDRPDVAVAVVSGAER